MDSSLIQTIAVYALPVIFAITLHEAAHGFAARYFGDSTAYVLGRVSLNPLKHIDPVGTILIPLALFILAKVTGGPPVLFGWAKPVPVNFGNLRDPKKNMLWVAAAGPASNLLMAMLWVVFFKFQALVGLQESFFIQMAQAGVMVNIVIMALNLLPIPPLDGGRMLISVLPHKLSWQLSRVEPYGFFILLFLMATHTLSFFINPLMFLGFSFLDLIFKL
ncbi:site-2 protease family protein [Ampullimonas aquatilis]|uniref:site-2 protease family protein n=1 Tax=Ampullimonas aquatilis TaxID=1341549 RepID=UPI003C70C191